MKIIPAKKIESCAECAYCRYMVDYELCTMKEFRKVNTGTIPSWCPLKDYKGWVDKPTSEEWWWYLYDKAPGLINNLEPLNLFEFPKGSGKFYRSPQGEGLKDDLDKYIGKGKFHKIDIDSLLADPEKGDKKND